MRRARFLIALIALVAGATARVVPTALAEPGATPPSCSAAATVIGTPVCVVDYQSSLDVTYRGQLSPGRDFTGTLQADLCTTATSQCVTLARHRFVSGAAVPAANDSDATAVARGGARYVFRVYVLSPHAVGPCPLSIFGPCLDSGIDPDAVGHFTGALVPVAGGAPTPGLSMPTSFAWTTPGKPAVAFVPITPASWFAGPLTISVSTSAGPMPSGATYETHTDGALGSTEWASISISTSASTAPGSYLLTVTATDANGGSASAPLTLTVQQSTVPPWTSTINKEYAAVGPVNEVADGVSNCDGARPALGLAPSVGAICFDVDDEDPVPLHVAITDDLFNPVAAEWYFDSDPFPLTSGTMCGSTDVAVPPSATHLWIILGTVEGNGSVPPQPACGQLSNPTHGTVTATGPVKA